MTAATTQDTARAAATRSRTSTSTHGTTTSPGTPKAAAPST